MLPHSLQQGLQAWTNDQQEGRYAREADGDEGRRFSDHRCPPIGTRSQRFGVEASGEPSDLHGKEYDKAGPSKDGQVKSRRRLARCWAPYTISVPCGDAGTHAAGGGLSA